MNRTLALLLICFPALAGTIYQTNLVSAGGSALSGQILFTPARNLPSSVPPVLADANVVRVNVTNGVLNRVLVAGDYFVKFPDSAKTFKIIVPDDGSTNTLEALAVTDFPGVNVPDVGIPTGGAAGQALFKSSSTNYDVAWGDIPIELPSGGDTGQVLSKASGTSYDVEWTTPEAAGSQTVVLVNGAEIEAPNFADASEVTFSVGSGTNVTVVLDSSIARDSELSSFLDESEASALYQGTNANLTAWAALAPESKQDAGAFLTNVVFSVNGLSVTNANFTNSTEITWTFDGSDISASLPLDLDQFVWTIEQDLSLAEKLVARQNIGAGAFFDASGFPDIHGKTNIVFTGPYLEPVAGTGFGMSGPVSSHVQVAFINTGDYGRIWNDTTVREVELYVPAALPATAEIYVDFWRIQSDNRCDLVGTTEDLRALLVADGTVQKVTLTIPINVRMGDVTGGHVVYDGSNWGAAFNTVVSQADQNILWGYSIDLRDGTPWFAVGVANITGQTIPIAVYGDAPVFCMFGDSRVDGYPYSNSMSKGYLTGDNWWSPDADPAYLFSQITGLSVRNEGRSGHDTGEMEDRIAEILEAKAQYYIFCTGDYNDFYAFPQRYEADFLLSCTNIIDAIIADGSRVIVVPGWPFKDPVYAPEFDTDIQNLTADEWMGSLEAIIVSQYSATDVLWADCREYMGQERPDTGSDDWRPFNRWDLVPLFRYGADMPDPAPVGAVDDLHWSKAGEEALARSIVAEIREPLKILNEYDTRYQQASANLTSLSAYGPTTWQATNANLTLLQAYGPTTWQATNANLTLLQAHGPTTWQATNAALTALAGNPQLYQSTNANLTLLSAYGPTTWQATNAALTALAGNPQLYQSTNANLTSWGTMTTNAFITSIMTKYEDIQIAGLATKLGSSPPDLGSFGPSGGLQAYLFDKTVDQQVYTTAQAPHAYKEGTDIYPHVHYTPVDTASNGTTTNVVWGLEYSWSNIDGTFAAPTTIYATNIVSATAWKHQVASFAAISGSGKTISSVLNLRVFRDADSASDNYDADAAFLQIDIAYQRDSSGSTTESVK